MSSSRSSPDQSGLAAVSVSGDGIEAQFTSPFLIGREEECDVRITGSARVSRRHAMVEEKNGRWWIRDLESANGLIVDGEKIDAVELEGTHTIQVGSGGPLLTLVADGSPENGKKPVSIDPVGRPDTSHSRPGTREAQTIPPESHTNDPAHSRPVIDSTFQEMPEEVVSEIGHAAASESDISAETSGGEDEDLSYSRIARHYFEESDTPAGERTQFIRKAYAEIQNKQRKQYGGIILAALGLVVLAAGIAVWQAVKTQRLHEHAEQVFFELREQELALASQLAADVELTPEQLAEMTARRQRAAAAYDGFVEELGVYRKLSEEERYIYNVARKFNESEFSIPAGFIREVQGYIRQWQSSDRFRRAVMHAEEMGYTPIIVRTLRRYGLPPEFFYLGMQESNFNARIVGPRTRWGIAKGAWQFIPETGQRYGLRIGPRADSREFDPQDQRHEFVAATDAAARYLLDIYTQLAQASGLLVCASYNWGEHRVAPRLDQLPPPGIERARAAMAGIPMNPQERSYWRFYTAHADRMPDETKGYVMHIFAAAVIGQNPRFFGIDMDNPLEKYLEAPLEELDTYLPAGDDFGVFEDVEPLDLDTPFNEPTETEPQRLGSEALRNR